MRGRSLAFEAQAAVSCGVFKEIFIIFVLILVLTATPFINVAIVAPFFYVGAASFKGAHGRQLRLLLCCAVHFEQSSEKLRRAGSLLFGIRNSNLVTEGVHEVLHFVIWLIVRL